MAKSSRGKSKKAPTLSGILLVVIVLAVYFFGGGGDGDASIPSVTLDEIPEYTDSPYVVIEDNIPEFDPNYIVDTSFEQYSELDDLGRCGTVIANIGTDLMCCNTLIKSFSAGTHRKIITFDSFGRAGQMISARHQVYNKTAKHQYFLHKISPQNSC